MLLNKREKILLIWYAHNFPLHKINIKIKICQTTIFLSWFMSCISFSSIDLSETNCLCKRANNFGGYVLFQERITCENFHCIKHKVNNETKGNYHQLITFENVKSKAYSIDFIIRVDKSCDTYSLKFKLILFISMQWSMCSLLHILQL